MAENAARSASFLLNVKGCALAAVQRQSAGRTAVRNTHLIIILFDAFRLYKNNFERSVKALWRLRMN